MKGPPRRRDPAVDEAACEGWDDRPHCAEGNRIHPTDQGTHGRHKIDRNCYVLPVEYDIFRSLIDVGEKFGFRKIIHEVK